MRRKPATVAELPTQLEVGHLEAVVEQGHALTHADQLVGYLSLDPRNRHSELGCAASTLPRCQELDRGVVRSYTCPVVPMGPHAALAGCVTVKSRFALSERYFRSREPS